MMKFLSVLFPLAGPLFRMVALVPTVLLLLLNELLNLALTHRRGTSKKRKD